MTNKAFNIMQSILLLLAHHGKLSPHQIMQEIQISKPTLNKYLNILLEQEKIIKIGHSPHIFYQISDFSLFQDKKEVLENPFSYTEANFLQKFFFKYDSNGAILQGVNGFLSRCHKRKLDPMLKYQMYAQSVQKSESFRNTFGLIEKKMLSKDDFQIFLADWYSIAEFGRSKWAEQLFFAKQHQNKAQILSVIEHYLLQIEYLIKDLNIDALALTPPSITRKHQILDLLDKKLNIKIPRIPLVKYSPSNILIPQKSLRSPLDRIENAQNTIFVQSFTPLKYKKVLLIDDFVGSGATLQETAKKLIESGCQKVVCFAFFGNLDPKFEVISEM